MLDAFEILTTSGIVLWSKKYVTISPAIINSLITNVFIEERTGAASADDIPACENPLYRYDKHTLKWTTAKELGLIFIAVYRSLLHLSWVDQLVDNIKTIFIDLYGDQLRKPHSTIVECKFDEYFDQQIGDLGKIAAPLHSEAADPISQQLIRDSCLASDLKNGPPLLPGLISKGDAGDRSKEARSNDSSPIPTPVISRSSTPVSHLLTDKTAAPRGRISRKLRKSTHSSLENIRSESHHKKNRDVRKKDRKWDSNGLPDDSDDIPLDYSEISNGDSSNKTDFVERPGVIQKIDHGSWGLKTSDGQFLLKDLDDQINSILASADAIKTKNTTPNGLMGSSLTVIGDLFRNVVGGKILTKADLDKAITSMEDHLLKKNVAREAAIRLCEGVEKELIGMKTGNFESIQTKIRLAMESSLRKILTPTSSLDLLREVDTVTSPKNISQKRRPYVISIVGVNGVGKSTSLSKICFFLLQNKYKVLVVACDTFRSGAVEQLAVHVTNLQELTAREGGLVQLYQKGYGKDAANVARDAVKFAAHEAFDVVMIDTAGRRHNDQRLMSSLEKFAKFANPDKILMVGEALVGTDSVAQARNFNAAFGGGRSLDGFVISKCDTVGDMIGTIVSMVHATNVPVLFVGVGQHYSDLRTMSVEWAVERLLASN